MIEFPPHISDLELAEVLYDKSSRYNTKLNQIIDKINYEYE